MSKKSIILILCFPIILALMSSSAGVTLIQRLDRTGSPLTQGTCVNCHGGGNFGTDVVIELIENNEVVTTYVPGKTYTIRMIINAMNNPEEYGWQMVVMNANNMSTGTLFNGDTGTQLVTLNGNRYFEHAGPQRDSVKEISWTAPEEGTGIVSIYTSALATNNDGNTSGDRWDHVSIHFEEDINAAISDVNSTKTFKISPTISSTWININSVDNINYERMTIYNQNGKEILSTPNNNNPTIDISKFENGLYFLKIDSKQGSQIEKIVKI